MKFRVACILLTLFMIDISCAQHMDDGLIHVEGGEFSFGNESGQTPSMEVVTVSSFYIEKHEITVAQWKDFIESSGEYSSAVYDDDLADPELLELPANGIAWVDALRYCNWRSLREGLEPAYSGLDGPISMEGSLRVKWNRRASGYRLPTEAEWEYAATGGALNQGYLYSGSNDVDQVAWWFGNSTGTVHKVMSKQPNELGLYDMSGNVNEMCWDLFDIDFSPGGQTDPIGPSIGNYPDFWPVNRESDKTQLRAIRGGSFAAKINILPVHTRGATFPIGDSRSGFRVVRSSR